MTVITGDASLIIEV